MNMTAGLSVIGKNTLAALAALGRVVLFALATLRHMVSGPFYLRELWVALIQIGWLSLPVVGLTALFTGGALEFIKSIVMKWKQEIFLNKIEK